MYRQLLVIITMMFLTSTYSFAQVSYIQDTIVIIDTLVVYDTVSVSDNVIVDETNLERTDSIDTNSSTKTKYRIRYFKDISILTADYELLGIQSNVSYRSFYILINVGINFNTSSPLIGGIGVGRKIDLTTNIYLTPELVSMWYFPLGSDYPAQNNNHIRMGVAYQLSPKFGIKITPSIYCGWRNNVAGNRAYNEISHIISPFVPFFATETGNDSTFDIGAGASLELIYHIR